MRGRRISDEGLAGELGAGRPPCGRENGYSYRQRRLELDEKR